MIDRISCLNYLVECVKCKKNLQLSKVLMLLNKVICPNILLFSFLEKKID